MNRELMLQELSDEQLELVTGGDTIVNIYYVYETNVNITNSILINVNINSFNNRGWSDESSSYEASQSYGSSEWDCRHRR